MFGIDLEEIKDKSPAAQVAYIFRNYRFNEFFKLESSSGILLLFFTVVALIWANSPWSASYFELWEHTYLTIGIGGWSLSETLIHWINDGLMAVFFFVVGMEIKREVLVGQLSSPRQAALPIAAAIGGMVLPALMYTALNATGAGAGGWGVPMATDIAFTLGLLALLGSRVPTSLKVFFTALAIADDLGAILVIALFYSSDIMWSSLLVALAIFIVLLIMNRVLHINRPIPYALLGIGLWLAFLYSGIHATLAGVLLAMVIPARNDIARDDFIDKAYEVLRSYEQSCCDVPETLADHDLRDALQDLEALIDKVQSPLQQLEHALHPWVTYGILPLFALANAGVALGGSSFDALVTPVSVGIVLGLVMGKSIGISLFSWLAVRLGLADLPEGLKWRQLVAASWLAGIGFTMSIFIANLAFEGSNLLEAAKFGIIIASLLAAVLGWLFSTLVSRTSDQAAVNRRLRGLTQQGETAASD
ncbi:MAG: Na+/H+ antiporter NhaA [Anaerolineae bacterium]